MQPANDPDIVPALTLEETELWDEPTPRPKRLPIWARLIMLGLASIWVTVFLIGALLDPYYDPQVPRVGASVVGLACSPDGQAPWLAVAAIVDEKTGHDLDRKRLPKNTGTHRGPPLNLPDCTFKEYTGLPCPSCGMTTSFSLLIHGDVWNSLKANFAGTALASIGLFYVPWSVLCAWKGRFLLIDSLEMTLFRLSLVFIVLLFVRWGMALALAYWSP